MVGKSSFRAIMRRSIFTFLQNFHRFTAAPSLLLLPYAAATLLSHPLLSSSYIFPIIHGRFTSIFLAAGFPPSSQLFSILNLKLSQTLLSSIFVSPFTLSFLLLSKSSVITSLQKFNSNNYSNKIITIFNRLFVTQICNSLVILSANATCFSLLVIAFNVSDLILGLSSHPRFVLLTSAIGAVVYSVVLANACVVCNLSLILSGLLEKNNNNKKKKNCCGFSSIVDACVVLMRGGGGGGVALSLAVAMNMGMAAIEALFQYRVVRAYYYYYRGDGGDVAALDWPVVLEAVVIAYMYGVVVVLDTIVGFVFLESCELDRCRVMEV
ncbi:hypothetical protein ABFS82_09G042600 [Erythranthe guttata]|nr:PREDICTED: uncharacterized protein LOC105959741 [Erythranthe guttata]|eukprot:XP_012839334.1 PREDICTED: uncharacterized protein LOC105959741 [Erythranthe guttata]